MLNITQKILNSVLLHPGAGVDVSMSDVVNLCQIDHKMSVDGDGGSNYKPPLSDSEQLGSCHFNKQHISVGKLEKIPIYGSWLREV